MTAVLYIFVCIQKKVGTAEEAEWGGGGGGGNFNIK